MCEGTGAQGPAGGQLRVLVVEDDTLIALDLAEMIRDMGAFVVGIAAFEADAVRLAAEHRPDLVLMDIVLRNGGDGVHAAEAIRAMVDAAIIFCTGNGDAATLRRIEDFGGAKLLLKPVDEACLREAIRRVCHAHRLAGSGVEGLRALESGRTEGKKCQ